MWDTYLIEERNKEIREIFELYDVDKDGKLSKKDLIIILKNLGHEIIELQIQENEIEDNLKSYCLNEFMSIMNSRARDFEIENELLSIFTKYDSDHSGKISVMDFRNVIIIIGSRFSEEEVEEFILEADPEMTGILQLNNLLSKMGMKFFL